MICVSGEEASEEDTDGAGEENGITQGITPAELLETEVHVKRALWYEVRNGNEGGGVKESE